MTYAEKIKDIGPISFEIDKGDSHPSGFGDMKDEGVLFNVVAAVALPQARQGMTPDAAYEAYNAERRLSWEILAKVEASLKAIGYEFKHKRGTEWKGEQDDYVAVDDHVAWLQVTKFPKTHELPDADATVKAVKDSLSESPFRDRLAIAVQSAVRTEIEKLAVETLKQDVKLALDRAEAIDAQVLSRA